MTHAGKVFKIIAFVTIVAFISIASIFSSVRAEQGTALAAIENQKIQSVVVTLEPGQILIHWTAPGDDGHIGRAMGYDLRCLPAVFGPIDNDTKWSIAIRVDGEPTPSPNGQQDSMIISGFNPGGSYYFCIKSYDDANNYSSMSNSPLLTAAGGNPGDFIPGDVNNSGHVDGNDVVYLVNYLRGGSVPPAPFLRADCDGSCIVNGIDVIYLHNYLMGSGWSPVRGNCLNSHVALINDNRDAQ
jgi:hypothetical protein